MCDKAINDSLAAQKLIPDWLVTSKIIKKKLMLWMEMKIYSNEDSGEVVFNYNEIGVVNIDLNHISLDDNFDKDDPDTIVLGRHLAWHIKFEKRKALKKQLNKELIPAAWHPSRWQHWCKSEDEKKKINQIFIEEL